MGQLDVLSCGHGDMKVTFDDKNPLELERAKRIIQDMLKRGYSLFVHGKDDVLTRVRSFDEKTNCYIIADGPLYAGDQPLSQTEKEEVATSGVVLGKLSMKRGRGRPKKSIHISSAKVTAVGRSAGG